jgi:ethanolamine utilization protein EutN
MLLAKVLGPVVATVKHPAFDGRALLIVQPIQPSGEPQGASFLAVDTVRAGEGDTVLVLREGSGVRQILQPKGNAPIRSIIAGIVDQVEVS